MLEQVLRSIHNMFVKTPNPGKFTISGGMVSPLPNLKDGQRIWIVGSDLNDGVYTYHDGYVMNDDDTAAAGLRDETFAGTICALAVPPPVIALCGEISEWVDKNGSAAETPYQSENVIGVYSYTKATGGTGAGGAVTWQDVFKTRLDPYRRIAL